MQMERRGSLPRVGAGINRLGISNFLFQKGYLIITEVFSPRSFCKILIK